MCKPAHRGYMEVLQNTCANTGQTSAAPWWDSIMGQHRQDQHGPQTGESKACAMMVGTPQVKVLQCNDTVIGPDIRALARTSSLLDTCVDVYSQMMEYQKDVGFAYCAKIISCLVDFEQLCPEYFLLPGRLQISVPRYFYLKITLLFASTLGAYSKSPRSRGNGPAAEAMSNLPSLYLPSQ